MARIVLTPGQIISGATLVKMFDVLNLDPNASIEPSRNQRIPENDPLREVKLRMEKRGLLKLFYESINSLQKEFAGCM